MRLSAPVSVLCRGALFCALAVGLALPAAASDEVIAMRGSRVEIAPLPQTKGVDALRGTRRGGQPELNEGTLRVRRGGRSALRAQLRGMMRAYQELGLRVPPSAYDALPLLGDEHALRGEPRPGMSREAFEQRELARARLSAGRSLLRAALPSAPAWLEVGFGQYLEGIEVAGGATAVYPPAAQDGALRLALAQERLLPLENVLARDRAGFDASVDGGLASAQAWGLVAWLMEQGEEHEAMRELLADVARDPDSTPRSLGVGYGGLAPFEREWRRSLARSRRPHLLFLTDELRRELEEPEPVVVVERTVVVAPYFFGGSYFGKPYFTKPPFGKPYFGRRHFGQRPHFPRPPGVQRPRNGSFSQPLPKGAAPGRVRGSFGPARSAPRGAPGPRP